MLAMKTCTQLITGKVNVIEGEERVTRATQQNNRTQIEWPVTTDQWPLTTGFWPWNVKPNAQVVKYLQQRSHTMSVFVFQELSRNRSFIAKMLFAKKSLPNLKSSASCPKAHSLTHKYHCWVIDFPPQTPACPNVTFCCFQFAWN